MLSGFDAEDRPARVLLPRRKFLAVCCAAIAPVVTTNLTNHIAWAAAPTASTSPAARKDAIKSIPFDKLEDDQKARISAVLNNTSIYRRLPTQVTQCDPDLYLFLVQHPEVIVDIWRVMGVSKVMLQPESETTFRANDGAGTTGAVEYCYQSHDTHVVYAEGAYDGPLMEKPIRAKCVLVLKSGYMQETDGRYYVTSRLDSFITIENAGVELLAKTLQPLVNKSADYNFSETAAFFNNVSRAAETNHRGVAKLASRLSGVEESVRDRFAELAVEIANKSATRQAAAVAQTKTSTAARPSTTARSTPTARPSSTSRRTANRPPSNKK